MTTKGASPQRERRRAQRARLDAGDMAPDPMVTLAGSLEPAGSGPVAEALKGAAPAVLLVWGGDGHCTGVEPAVRDVAGAMPVPDRFLGESWLDLGDLGEPGRWVRHQGLVCGRAKTRGIRADRLVCDPDEPQGGTASPDQSHAVQPTERVGDVPHAGTEQYADGFRRRRLG